MLNNNPLQTMAQLKQYMNDFNGNPQEMGMRKIQEAHLNQQQLNALQQQANYIYSLAEKFGLIK